MKKSIMITLIVTVSVMGLPLWSMAAEVPKTIKLGSACSLTGAFGSGGAQCKAGYEIAVEQINKKGGVFVKEFNKKIPLELVLLDDESDMTLTVNRMETLYSVHKITAYLGGFSSAIHAAQAPIAEKNKVPLLMVASALLNIHQKGYKYNFSPFPKTNDSAKAVFSLLDSLPSSQRPKKVAMFLEKSPQGVEQGAMWKEEAPKLGYEVVLYREHPRDMKDFSSFIMLAKAAEAEILLTGPATPEGIALTKQMKELDYNPKFYLAYRAADVMAWGEALRKDGDYVVFLPVWNAKLKHPGIPELNESHVRLFGRQADVTVGPAYACVQVLVNAIEKAGTLQGDKLRDAIASTDMMTVIGPLKFRPDGTGVVTLILGQWQKGKQEVIWPKELSTTSFLYPAPKWKER